MLKTSILSAAAFGVAMALAPTGVSAATVMKIGFATINDGQHKSADWIAKEVMKRTNGSIDVKVYPAAQLGKIPRQIEGVLFGTQEAFISPPGFFKGLNPAFAAPDAPGLFNSFAHQTKTMNHPSVREKFLNLATAKGVTGVYIAAAGASAMAMRDPVRKLSDVKGKKIRVLASPIEVVSILGLIPDYKYIEHILRSERHYNPALISSLYQFDLLTLDDLRRTILVIRNDHFNEIKSCIEAMKPLLAKKEYAALMA